MFDQTHVKQLIQTAEQAWYASPRQTCLMRGYPNEPKIEYKRNVSSCCSFVQALNGKKSILACTIHRRQEVDSPRPPPWCTGDLNSLWGEVVRWTHGKDQINWVAVGLWLDYWTCNARVPGVNPDGFEYQYVVLNYVMFVYWFFSYM